MGIDKKSKEKLKMKLKRLFLIVMLVLACGIICSCGEKLPAEVEQKAAEYMEALKAGDVDAVYEMMSPDSATKAAITTFVENLPDYCPLADGYTMELQKSSVNRGNGSYMMQYLVKVGSKEYVMNMMYYDAQENYGFMSVDIKEKQ